MLKLIKILFFLSPFSIFAQVNIINRSLTDTSLAYAYIGVDNVIELTGLKTGNSTISFFTTNGAVTNLGQNRYVLRLTRQGECTLTFKVKGKTIARRDFTINTIPDPVTRMSNAGDSIQIGDTRSLVISLNKLVNDPVLRVHLPNCFLKYMGQILSYKITLDGASFEDFNEFFVMGAKINDVQIKQISKRFAKRGYMYVEEIRFVFLDGRVIKLSPLFYYVTN